MNEVSHHGPAGGAAAITGQNMVMHLLPIVAGRICIILAVERQQSTVQLTNIEP